MAMIKLCTYLFIAIKKPLLYKNTALKIQNDVLFFYLIIASRQDLIDKVKVTGTLRKSDCNIKGN